jgi:hypothetical protein
MKCGTGCFMTWARRMAERDLDCFLLGTAMVCLSIVRVVRWGTRLQIFRSLSALSLELAMRCFSSQSQAVALRLPPHTEQMPLQS